MIDPIDESAFEKRHGSVEAEMSSRAGRFFRIILILPFVSALLALGGLATKWVHDRKPPSSDPKTFYRIVTDQVLACRTDNYEGAYRHASTEIRKRFSLEQFASMVRTDYSTLTAPAAIEFGPLYESESGQRAWLKLYFIEARGKATPCVYHFVREKKTWRVDGVQLMPAKPVDNVLSGTRA